MKFVLFFFQILLFIPASVANNDTINLSSKITDVTVFFNGAQVTREAQADLKKGKQIVVFENLPVDLSESSIRVKGCADCVVQSIKHQLNYVTKTGTDEEKVRDEITEYSYKIKDLSNRISVLDIEEQLLHKNNKFSGSDQTTQIGQLKEAADFYGIKINQLRAERLERIQQMEEMVKHREELFGRLNKLRAENKTTTSKVMMTVTAQNTGNRTLQTEYYVHGAGWEPTYDFRVDDVDDPLSIIYNANIYQSSGENWNNVKLNLSTGNPALSSSKPRLEPWYIDKKPEQKSADKKLKTGALRGVITDSKSGDVLPDVQVIIKKDNKRVAGTFTDYSGNFNIKPLITGKYTLEAQRVGHANSTFSNVVIKENEVTVQNIKMNPTQIVMSEWENHKLPEVEHISATLDMERKAKEHVIYVRGARGSETLYFIDGIKVRGSMSKSESGRTSTDFITNTLEENVSHAEYVIDEPYTILSTGEDYNIQIKEVKTDADYTYYTVPKEDPDVFLVVRLNDPAELNLLPGRTSIFFAGTFTGQSYLQPWHVRDTLEISLGRDKNISVERTGIKQVREKRIFGNSVREKVGWEIKVRNNKSKAVDVIIQDQYPITQKAAISIDLTNAGDADVEKDKGFLEWNITLDPNQTKTVSFDYEIKYPNSLYD